MLLLCFLLLFQVSEGNESVEESVALSPEAWLIFLNRLWNQALLQSRFDQTGYLETFLIKGKQEFRDDVRTSFVLHINNTVSHDVNAHKMQ